MMRLRILVIVVGRRREATENKVRKLDRDVKDFFRYGVPQEDKIKLMGYTESLDILMNAVNNGLLT